MDKQTLVAQASPWRRARDWFWRYGAALASVASVTYAMTLVRPLVEPANISLTYLLAVLVAAAIGGSGPGLLASLLGFLGYNFFFVQPLYVLTVANPQDVARLCFFLVAALLASSLTGLVRRQAAQIGRLAAQEAAERLKSTLLASVSHDLRSPLATITGVATALRQADAPWDRATSRRMLDTLILEAERLDRVLGNLLDMSRIEGGALNLTCDWEDPADLVGAVLARLRPQLAGRAVRVHAPDDLPTLSVNAGLIDQALSNLVENALKYTPAGTPITVALELAPPLLHIHVLDAGPGIPAAALPHLFEKFFRVADPERHAPGTGLGLAICRGIVQAHGGQVAAANRAEGGARFTISLPLRPAAPPPLAKEPAP